MSSFTGTGLGPRLRPVLPPAALLLRVLTEGLEANTDVNTQHELPSQLYHLPQVLGLSYPFVKKIDVRIKQICQLFTVLPGT